MQAMILCAGRGTRLASARGKTPKPLVAVGGVSVLAGRIAALADAGFSRFVVNVSPVGGGRQIEARVARWRRGFARGLEIRFSREESPLETAGGIRFALRRGALDSDSPFVAVNADILCDFDCARLRDFRAAPNSILARLVLVDNPPHRPAGDFVLRADGGVATLSTAATAAATAAKGARALTFSGIGVYRPRLFADIADGQTIGLAAVLQKAIAGGAVAGEYHRGLWADIGAPSRLAAARARFVNLRPLARARAKIRATD